MDHASDSNKSDEPLAGVLGDAATRVPLPLIPAAYTIADDLLSDFAPPPPLEPVVLQFAGLPAPLPLPPRAYAVIVRPRPSVAATLAPKPVERPPAPIEAVQIAQSPFRAAVITELEAPAVLSEPPPAQRVAPVFAPPPQPEPQVSKPHPVIASPTERLEPSPGIPRPAEEAGRWEWLKRVARVAVLAVAGYIALVIALIFLYRFVPPPVSSLMIQRWLTGEEINQTWVDLEEISPSVVRAVLLSEDGRFCDHNGIDYDAIQEAIERAGDGTPRGASTISMQVIKNLFLWPSKSYVRKAVEVPLTYLMEALWPKSRIMEVYLNIAEWGPGIFGVEAAARYHYDKSARKLSSAEAARLAVALPNPIRRDAGDPGPGTLRLAAEIQSRMRAAPSSQTSCVLPGKAS